jgi:hypothetical protein
MAGIGKGIAAGVPEHVGVNRKDEATAHADALDQPIDGIGRERPPRSVAKTKALSGKCRRNLRRARNLVAARRMRAS